jgi:hypothetical protein
MSTTNAESYGRHARETRDIKEMSDNMYRAIDELIRAIQVLDSRIGSLESRGATISDYRLGFLNWIAACCFRWRRFVLFSAGD